jgi:hypothetical protein
MAAVVMVRGPKWALLFLVTAIGAIVAVMVIVLVVAGLSSLSLHHAFSNGGGGRFQRPATRAITRQGAAPLAF